MKILRPLPPNRTLEQVWNHYRVEKAIADKIKNADREGRRRIYATMYDELFEQVPDHPRLTLREDEQQTRTANKSRMALIREFLKPWSTFVEFAPGDCQFAQDVAERVKIVYGVDISDQRSRNLHTAENFSLIVYDGYKLDGIDQSSVDLVFSDQLIEHLHPEETRMHFELVYHIIKPGGRYVFRTPHALSGPHDVSQYFSDEAQGFHLKEWTYRELRALLEKLKFSRVSAVFRFKGMQIGLPCVYSEMCERILELFPRACNRVLARYLMPSVCIVATK